MEIDKIEAIIEAILFATGRSVTEKELQMALEIPVDDLRSIIHNMQKEYEEKNRGIELIQIEDSYQLCSKKDLHNYVCQVIDKRSKPRLSNASLETLAIIAYNPRVTRAEIEAIRGVSADASIYKLLEYDLIEEAGKVDMPGKPMSYKTTKEFLKTFGYISLKDLPELPRYRLDENKQIVIDDLIEEGQETRMPEREDIENENN